MVIPHFRDLSSFRIGLVGDLMLDRYTIGSVSRISPEAPVVVLAVQNERVVLGGAGNVLLELLHLQSEVSLLSRIGSDPISAIVYQELSKTGIRLDSLIRDPDCITPEKHRLVAAHQQLLRVDRENIIPLANGALDHMLDRIPSFIDSVDILTLSDYGKGLLTHEVTQHLIRAARNKAIPVIVDPKGSDFSKYYGATLIKPNEQEAYTAARLPHYTPLEEVADVLFHITGAHYILITRSEHGMSLFSQQGKREDLPSIVHDVKDVTGAGDIVLAIITIGILLKLDFVDMMMLSTLAASIAIEKMGCVLVSQEQIIQRWHRYHEQLHQCKT